MGTSAGSTSGGSAAGTSGTGTSGTGAPASAGTAGSSTVTPAGSADTAAIAGAGIPAASAGGDASTGSYSSLPEIVRAHREGRPFGVGAGEEVVEGAANPGEAVRVTRSIEGASSGGTPVGSPSAPAGSTLQQATRPGTAGTPAK
jgi:hypothetical protein